jgi:predicted enzyme related to lactoylglutathione lyase
VQECPVQISHGGSRLGLDLRWVHAATVARGIGGHQRSPKGRQFWGSLFDWQFEASPGPFEYHMTRISDQAGAAITNMEPGERGIRTYFYVDDINAGAARVKELGGEANDPGSVPGMGWFAVCKDTEGNEFGLWQNDPSAPAPAE